MSEGKTPRTDAEMNRIENNEKLYEDRHDCYCALLDFCRKLETELDQLRVEIERTQSLLKFAEWRIKRLSGEAAK